MIVVLNDAPDLLLRNTSNDRNSWFSPAAPMNVFRERHLLVKQHMSDVKLFVIAHLTLRATSPWLGMLVSISHLPIETKCNFVNSTVGPM
jgi:hypothetical protein